jgi:hypothetical protein
MDPVREELMKWHQMLRALRTHLDTRVDRKDLSGHLPSRVRSHHPREALSLREQKNG